MTIPASSSPLVRHVLVADSGMARLMRLTGPHRHRSLEQEELFERPSAHLPAHELTTDISGRVFESSGRGGSVPTRTRHGAASDYDPHKVEIERYVARIAEHLEARHRAGQLSNLTLVAEPHLLGVLRARLPDEIQRLVTGQISGDYVRADPSLVLRVIEEADEEQASAGGRIPHRPT